ncbi:MAG: ATP-binding protein [Rhizobiales bacterium]|nr:ATP-binding protein [Hyphomicrobiales bacterium]
MNLHPGARLHAFVNGLFRPKEEVITHELWQKVEQRLAARDLLTDEGRALLAEAIADKVGAALEERQFEIDPDDALTLVDALIDYEGMFRLPRFDWDDRHTTSQIWALRDALNIQKALIDHFDEATEVLVQVAFQALASVADALPRLEPDLTDAIVVPTDKIRTIGQIGDVVESVMSAPLTDDVFDNDLFPRLRDRIDANLVAASGGDPGDVAGFKRTPRPPSRSDIRDPREQVQTYLGGTPLTRVFDGNIDFAIPNKVRFEHHHIVAGSGHGKTQTLQYLIAKDLEAITRGERSVIVIDSQGDLIQKIAQLKLFAPGEPLHDRVVIIDPSDVEWPVSLNLFDVGIDRLNAYPMLERERLTNSILELYDFVLGSLLSAEMTQKQNVIFRYVTRLMLHIPDATIHTLRELMEKGSEIKFAEHIAKLQGTARHFFETEFPSKEFSQTRQQVLRRLWGILENQTFERMFSHPRSKLDLFTEMNAGKVILINTAKDLLKEQGTEIFGRFFIALIAQAAQERATLAEGRRMPTFVYIDEAADYFDRNIGIILSQARKYNVGMVLAHQYLGQLEPRLQEAFAANTSIKFAGGVSAKDARALAPMLHCEPALIEGQPRLSFAAFVRGLTKSALPLAFPAGYLEDMARMTDDEREALRQATREKYAVHYSKLAGDSDSDDTGPTDDDPPDGDPGGPPKGGGSDDVDTPDVGPSPEW